MRTEAADRWFGRRPGLRIAIDRADDPRLSDYRHVGDHRWLAGRGLFVAEGRYVVQRLLEAARFRIHSILLTPAAFAGLAGAADIGAPVYVAEQGILNDITGFNFHRGCLALAHRPASTGSSFAGARRLLALEGVGNPDNVGGLFRVAAAFGADGLLLDPASGDPYYRKAIRTSMGAVLDLPFERIGDWPFGLASYRALGFTLVALTPRPEAQPVAVFAREAPPRVILLAGAEGPGLSAAALEMADARVRIPMALGVDSLNVTVATGIALAHLDA